MMYKKIFSMLLVATLAFGLSSCNSDNGLENKPVSENIIVKAKEMLNGDIVLGSHATVNGVNKTLLKTGAPVKFNFLWDEKQADAFTLSIIDFHVGSMPFTINFKTLVHVTELNSFEKQEYKGDGWIKFKGNNGSIFIVGLSGQEVKADGSFIQGYYNVYTKEINFIIDYNLMNVRSECYLQVIDKNRLANYEAEKAQYAKDLEEAKKKQGLN